MRSSTGVLVIELKPMHMYSEDSLPSYPCTVCVGGYLCPIHETFHSAETQTSITARDDPDWGPEWYRSRASVRMCCNVCGDEGMVVFEGTLTYPEPPDDEWDETFNPVFCYPPPHLIAMDDRYPKEVRETLLGAFPLIWSDCLAAGVRLRTVLERLLDDLNIESIRRHSNGIAQLSKKGRPIKIPLQERIDAFSSKGAFESKLKGYIESVKWLGNHSAHEAEQIDQVSVNHAFSIVDAVLRYVYCGETVSKETEYSKESINLFYHPTEQTSAPVTVIRAMSKRT